MLMSCFLQYNNENINYSLLDKVVGAEFPIMGPLNERHFQEPDNAQVGTGIITSWDDYRIKLIISLFSKFSYLEAIFKQSYDIKPAGITLISNGRQVCKKLTHFYLENHF